MSIMRLAAWVPAGRYCENCQVAEIAQGPVSPVSPGVRPYALDPQRAKAFWARSEDMVGERFSF